MVDKHEEAQLRLCGLFRKTDNDECRSTKVISTFLWRETEWGIICLSNALTQFVVNHYVLLLGFSVNKQLIINMTENGSFRSTLLTAIFVTLLSLARIAHGYVFYILSKIWKNQVIKPKWKILLVDPGTNLDSISQKCKRRCWYNLLLSINRRVRKGHEKYTLKFKIGLK